MIQQKLHQNADGACKNTKYIFTASTEMKRISSSRMLLIQRACLTRSPPLSNCDLKNSGRCVETKPRAKYINSDDETKDCYCLSIWEGLQGHFYGRKKVKVSITLQLVENIQVANLCRSRRPSRSTSNSDRAALRKTAKKNTSCSI